MQKENINAVKTFQQTATDHKSLKAPLYALKQRLALIGINGDNLQESGITGTYAITSPIDGYVAEVNVTLGKFVSPNDVVYRIFNNTQRLVPNTALQALVGLGEQPVSAVADDALVSASGKDYI